MRRKEQALLQLNWSNACLFSLAINLVRPSTLFTLSFGLDFLHLGVMYTAMVLAVVLVSRIVKLLK